VEVVDDINGFEERAISIEIPPTFKMGSAGYGKSCYIPRKIKAGQTRNGKHLLCVRWRPICLAALLNDFTKLTRGERRVPDINERGNTYANWKCYWYL